MGLIMAAKSAVKGVFGDQWKEFFYCDSLDKDTLVAKGQKKTSGRSNNFFGEDNIISDGSGIAVNEGQCMIIVEQGKVVEVCAQPGEFTFDKSTEPSLFAGNLGESIINTFKTIGRRIAYSGDTAKDQRIYYFNTKEIMDNKFGTANPLMFRVVDRNIGLDREVSVKCHGIYSYKITDPILFYANVCGNVGSMFTRDEIDSTLKGEFMDALQPSFARLSELSLRPSQIPAHALELKNAMNEALNDKWQALRGITIVSIALAPIILSEEDMKKIQDFQDRAVLRDPGMAAATLVGAQAEALKAAASNEAGAMMGFMGLGMAQQAGGFNAQNLFEMSNQNKQQAQSADMWKCECGAVNSGKFCNECGKPKPQAQISWQCECGQVNTGNFCSQCGKPKPQAADGWQCECGTVNKGKFCSNCGKAKPSGAPLYRCDKCGWEPEDPMNPPKFCPECGDPFDTNDAK